MKNLLDKIYDFTLRMSGYMLEEIYGEEKGKYLWQAYRDFNGNWFRWWGYLDENNRTILADYISQEKPEEVVVVYGEVASLYNNEMWTELRESIKNYDGECVRRKFATKEEADAYIKGVDDSDGWLDYAVVEKADIPKIIDD